MSDNLAAAAVVMAVGTCQHPAESDHNGYVGIVTQHLLRLLNGERQDFHSCPADQSSVHAGNVHACRHSASVHMDSVECSLVHSAIVPLTLTLADRVGIAV